MLFLYYAALFYFALLSSAETTPPAVVKSSSYKYKPPLPKEGNIYGISHSPIDTEGRVTTQWSFKAFYIGSVPGDPRLAFVAAVSLFDPLPEYLIPRGATIRWVEKDFAPIFEKEYKGSQINIRHAQVVEKKDLQPIRDERLTTIARVRLAKEALNEIRTNMVINFSERRDDFKWIGRINWPPESGAPLQFHSHNALGIRPTDKNRGGREMGRRY